MNSKLVEAMNRVAPELFVPRGRAGRGLKKLRIDTGELVLALLKCDDPGLQKYVERLGASLRGLTTELEIELFFWSRSNRSRGRGRQAPPGYESYVNYLWEKCRLFFFKRKVAEQRLGSFSYAADTPLGPYCFATRPSYQSVCGLERKMAERKSASPWWGDCPLARMQRDCLLTDEDLNVLELLLVFDLFSIGPYLNELLLVKDICKLQNPWSYPKNRFEVIGILTRLEEAGLVCVDSYFDEEEEASLSQSWVYLAERVVSNLMPHNSNLSIDSVDQYLVENGPEIDDFFNDI